MAQKKSASSTGTRVHRVKATDDSPKKQPAKKSADAPKKTRTVKAVETKRPVKKTPDALEQPTKNPFKALGRYFKGAWSELKQVRWPNRAATWGLTLAVLIFTGIFVVFILLLDTGFQWLFEQILR